MAERGSGAAARPHAFVTGAGSGIGAAAARSLVAAGWRVSGCGRRAGPLQELARELGPAFLPVVADVRDQAALDDACARAAAAFGPLRAVVANAGHGLDGELLELSAADLHAVMDTNLYGVHRTVLASRPHWDDRPRIVIVASVVSFVTVPRMGAYCASKHAVDSYASALRMELRTRGVRVCTVNPGTVDTPFFTDAPAPGRAWTWRPGTPLRPGRVAAAIVAACRRGRPRRRLMPFAAVLAAWVARRFPGLLEAFLAGKLEDLRRSERQA